MDLVNYCNFAKKTNINEIQNSSNYSLKISEAIDQEKLSVEQINRAMIEVNSGAQYTALVSDNIASNVEILKAHAEKLKNLLANS